MNGSNPKVEQNEADLFFSQLTSLKTEGVFSDKSEELQLARHLLDLHKANPPDPVFVRKLEISLRAKLAEQISPIHTATVTLPPNDSKEENMKQMLYQKRILRKGLSLVAGVAIVIGMALSVPSIRSFAQDIIRQIGNVVITDKPSPGEKMLQQINSGTPQPTPIHLEGSENNPPVPLSLQEASQAIGFEVYAPGYLPVGFRFRLRTVTEQEPLSATTWYQDTRYGQGELFISQVAGNSSETSSRWTFDVGDTSVVNVNIGNYEGVWVEGYAIAAYMLTETMEQAGISPLVQYNLLIWEQGEFTFVIMTELPLELASLVAQSLTPIPPFAEYAGINVEEH